MFLQHKAAVFGSFFHPKGIKKEVNYLTSHFDTTKSGKKITKMTTKWTPQGHPKSTENGQKSTSDPQGSPLESPGFPLTLDLKIESLRRGG